MNNQQAFKLLDETFNKDFKIQQITILLKELLNTSKLYSDDKSRFIANEFKDYILKVTKLGQYEDRNKDCIELLAVKLKKHSSLERARTMQRSFVAKWLANNSSEPKGAIVAFYDDTPDWRFSFVKLEYSLVKDEKGNLKTKKELTPAKRYSFLVGVNEPNHTCKRQFVDLLTNDEHYPILKEIEYAFSIEKVTKVFFEKYKELFLRLKEELEKIVKKEPNVRKEFISIVGDNKEDLEKFCVEFSKKLLGQIVFLYFLQKKGWLGVKKDESGKFKDWGTGPKDFMRRLFRKEYGDYKNFFNDILEPLFYNTLAVKRTADYSDKFNCKIPFLNGGLFEPIDEYDWVNTRIYMDDKIFKDIFDTFDEFNFTVKEDEPLEKEVAVDPEMLGKVFENLLEVSDRKSKGAFYTPREIVHYMCQQSLINYIETNTGIKREDIETFIQMGDLALDQTIKAMKHKKKYHGNTYDIDSKYLIPQSIEDNFELIDKLLADIKVVDPAVGSGAFPVGMMNEIVKARSILSIFFKEDRNVYDFKRECVENSLYGVDIMPSAVDICQLRFWLSLIVDEVDKDKVKPLPNLDNKIMCGNSLLEEFEGVKLFDESLLGETQKVNAIDEINRLNTQKAALLKEDLSEEEYDKKYKEVEKQIRKLEKEAKKDKYSSQSSLHDALTNKIAESKEKLIKIKQLQKEFFSEYDRDKKKALKEKIDDLEWELIEVTLQEQGNEEALKRLKDIKKSKSKPFFLWKLYFADVFQRENPGFDVVIANPPYVNANELKKIMGPDQYTRLKSNYVTAKGTVDLYIYFMEKGVSILRSWGNIIYITPNRYLSASYGKTLRDYLLNNTKMISIADYSSVRVFQEASTYPIVSHYKKIGKPDSYSITIRTYNPKNSKLLSKRVESEKLSLLNENIWGFLLNDKMEVTLKVINQSKPLTDCGKINATSTASEADNYHSLINEKNGIKIINTGTIDKYTSLWGYKKFIDKGENFLKPLLRKDNKVISKNRIKLYNSKKIIFAKIAITPEAFLDEEGDYASINTNCIHTFSEDYNPKYVLAWVNSKLFQYTFECFFDGLKMAGGFLLYSSPNLSNTFIMKATGKEQKLIVKLVDEILSIIGRKDYFESSSKKSKVNGLEKEIDKLFYKLYNLTPKEIKVVEEFNGDK